MGDEAQRHELDSDARDSLNTKVVPVILVPGVMGSRISLPSNPDWDPDVDAVMALWSALATRAKAAALDPSRTPGTLIRALSGKSKPDILARPGLEVLAGKEQPGATAETVYTQRGWGTVSWAFYGKLLIHLEEQLNIGRSMIQFPVYASGYDWRQSNALTGRTLGDVISAIIGQHRHARRAILVTHSMGGLVTRAALAQAQDKIAGVVHCVMPCDGAAVAYRRFHTGARDPWDAPQSPNPSLIDIIAATVLNRIMGTDPVSYAISQSVLRGPVELLPSNNYDGLFLEMADGTNNRTVGDVYSVYEREGPPGIIPRLGAVTRDLTEAWQAADGAALRARVAGARAFHQAVFRVFHPNTFILVGDALRTDTNFDWNLGEVGRVGGDDDLNLKISQFAVQGADPSTGDGTVPAVSARTPSLATPLGRFAFNGAEHAGCFETLIFRRRVEECVRVLFASA